MILVKGMIYLKSFTLLDDKEENNYVLGSDIRNIYNNYYPIGIFSSKRDRKSVV